MTDIKKEFPNDDFNSQINSFGYFSLTAKTRALFVSFSEIGYRYSSENFDKLKSLIPNNAIWTENQWTTFNKAVVEFVESFFSVHHSNIEVLKDSVFKNSENSFSCIIYDPSKVCFLMVDTFSKLMEEISNLKSTKKMYYRGELAKWNPIPSIFRNRASLINEVLSDEKIISAVPDEFQNCNTDFDKLVKLKHYAQASRLLDLTKNPLVALFFTIENMENAKNQADGVIRVCFSSQETEKVATVSDTVSLLTGLSKTSSSKCKKMCSLKNFDAICSKSCNEAECKEQTSQDDTEEKPILCPYLQEVAYRTQRITGIDYPWNYNMITKDLNKTIIVHPPYNNYRITQQQGLFLMCGRNCDNIYSFPKDFLDFWNNPLDGKKYNLYIPRSSVSSFKKLLDSLGINKHYIYGNLENAVKSL